MMTVRFPNGQAIQYNDAQWLTHGDDTWILKNRKDGDHIAFIQASAGVIVEFTPPCRVYDPIAEKKTHELAEEVRKLRNKIRKPR